MPYDFAAAAMGLRPDHKWRRSTPDSGGDWLPALANHRLQRRWYLCLNSLGPTCPRGTGRGNTRDLAPTKSRFAVAAVDEDPLRKSGLRASPATERS